MRLHGQKYAQIHFATQASDCPKAIHCHTTDEIASSRTAASHSVLQQAELTAFAQGFRRLGCTMRLAQMPAANESIALGQCASPAVR